MKIKHDFVTNSSSASYLLYIDSNTNDLEEFTEQFEKYLKEIRSEYDWDSWDSSADEYEQPKFYQPKGIENVGGTVFLVTEWTSMYNYTNDIPTYMAALLVKSFDAGELERWGFKGVKFKIVNDY